MPDHRFAADAVPDHAVTPPEVFFNRRRFMQTAAAAGIFGSLAACTDTSGGTTQDAQQATDPRNPPNPRNPRIVPPRQWPEGFAIGRNDAIQLPAAVERRDTTPRLTAASHNNFYEFLPGRGGDVWPLTSKFDLTTDWKVEVTGACAKPMVFDLDDLQAFPHEERMYHFRCVERWAMNVPWVGFPLRLLLEQAEPTAEAKFVRFVTANRPEQMPGLRDNRGGYPWPYHEALRMDEAMHELTLVCTGVYGEPLPKQHGAPVRIIVPWKYGYKNPKSIVRIELTREQPPTFWSMPAYRHEYGFLSNVNPNLPHPRWSQAQSYWLDTRERFDTPIFNGYGKYVAALYPDEPTTPQKALGRGETAR